MTEVGSKAEISQVVDTNSEDHLTEINLSMNKISEEERSGEGYWEKEAICDEDAQEISGLTAGLTEKEIGHRMESFRKFLKRYHM